VILIGLSTGEPSAFRSAWFIESVLSAALIALVIRTPRAFVRSIPGAALVWASTGAAAIALVLTFTQAPALGFVRVPMPMLAFVVAIVVLYALTAEMAKRAFYRRVPLAGTSRDRRV
jgi:Mg2+-importing ATPase